MAEDGDSKELVGYKSPPASKRFKKGVSGNPSGRPKAIKGMESLVQNVLGQKMVINSQGEARQVTIKEALIWGLTKKALSGDTRALKTLLEYAPKEIVEPPTLTVRWVSASAPPPSKIVECLDD